MRRSRSCSLAACPRGGTNFNIVPDEFSFTIDRRPNPEGDHEAAKAELLGVLDEARSSRIAVDWKVIQDSESSFTDRGGELPEAVASATLQISG